MENDQVMEKESDNCDKAIKRVLIHQNQFVEEDVSASYLVGTQRAKINAVKEY